ncbi:UNVERIFIED_CONTAM: hypothetical protein PYX00_000503 [Menopon gallinae]|uniref:Small ribosomal subunit protein mS29 n=1 Tax=Menopon gallinae TaxID=328185 RepID=A0AAW2IAM5_9NEOP
MALIFRRKCLRHCFPYFSTSAEVKVENDTPKFRTDKTNPADHTKADIGLFYTLPQQLALRDLFGKRHGFPTPFLQLCHTFRETCIMVRKPGLELLHYLKNADYTKPINKYVIYGRKGSGKTMVVNYAVHYAYLQGWLLVNLAWVPLWLSRPQQVSPSSSNPDNLNLIGRSVSWLQQFKRQNLKLLTENQLPIQNDYVWNKRESSKVGDSLLSMVDYGISRGTFSTDVINILLKEVKLMSKSGLIKTLVVIDGYNALFRSESKVMDTHRNIVPPNKLNPLKAFIDLTIADWHSGAAILTCDQLAAGDNNESYFPHDLLSTEGYEHLYPFVPIEVPRYSDQEFENALEYYRDRKWLRTRSGDTELKFLTGRVGYELMRICAPL